MSFEMLRDSWRAYQRIVKAAKTKQFSDIIILNCHKPHVLFKTVNSILNVPPSAGLEASNEVCENFLGFY